MTKCKSCHAMKHNRSHLCFICFDQLRHLFGGKNHGGRHYCPSCGCFFLSVSTLHTVVHTAYVMSAFITANTRCTLCVQRKPKLFLTTSSSEVYVCNWCDCFLIHNLLFCPICCTVANVPNHNFVTCALCRERGLEWSFFTNASCVGQENKKLSVYAFRAIIEEEYC